ncbi:hypothetical protein RUM44_007023 [Polyplax serrata]|uniref:Ig-like domain-containing protein n=1 Tax=Polyplax serrata TaxID=468196 RepID=A0ABR1B1F1_POLSC
MQILPVDTCVKTPVSPFVRSFATEPRERYGFLYKSVFYGLDTFLTHTPVLRRTPASPSKETNFTKINCWTVLLPESNLKFWHTVDPDNREDNSVESDYSRDENLVNVTCVAEGVYPEPIIRIFSASRPISDKTHMRFNLRNGLYDVTASIQVDDDDMDPDEHVFECELSIPETNYTVKEALYVSLGTKGLCPAGTTRRLGDDSKVLAKLPAIVSSPGFS